MSLEGKWFSLYYSFNFSIGLSFFLNKKLGKIHQQQQKERKNERKKREGRKRGGKKGMEGKKNLNNSWIQVMGIWGSLSILLVLYNFENFHNQNLKKGIATILSYFPLMFTWHLPLACTGPSAFPVQHLTSFHLHPMGWRSCYRKLLMEICRWVVREDQRGMTFPTSHTGLQHSRIPNNAFLTQQCLTGSP